MIYDGARITPTLARRRFHSLQVIPPINLETHTCDRNQLHYPYGAPSRSFSTIDPRRLVVVMTISSWIALICTVMELASTTKELGVELEEIGNLYRGVMRHAM